MRRCIVNMMHCVCINPDAPATVKKDYKYQVFNTVEANFHQFITETDPDGTTIAVAIVEYDDGTVNTVPLSWLTFTAYKPAILESATLSYKPLVDMSQINSCLDRICKVLEDVACR